jgi:cytochrome c biogenesis protein CcmG/thiol:disulfide interchange protein DsbE
MSAERPPGGGVPSDPGRAHSARPLMLRPWFIVGAAFVAAAAIVVAALLAGPAREPALTVGSPGATAAGELASNPNLDPGSRLSGPAPAFSLTDQFGHRVSLRLLRGRVVLLAFADPRCTATCPLTTATMTAAVASLGPEAANVALVGIDANPQATAVRWLRAYSQAHGLLHHWSFLTGSPSALRSVWARYHVSVAVDSGQVEQTPALYVIDASGDWRRLYITQQSYSTIGQQARIVAQALTAALEDRSPSSPRGSFAEIAPLRPDRRVAAPLAGGGSARLGPGAPRLAVFGASWLSETSDLRGELHQLAAYRRLAVARGLPRPVLVDEQTVEPAGGTAALHRLASAQGMPLALDRDGRLADGYLVQDLAWLVLTSRSGQILWSWDASTQGWPSPGALAHHVRAALSSPAAIPPPSPATARRLLAGAPPILAAIHAQASQLLGGEQSLQARLAALRGYPVVLNAWASWCPPCRQEYPLFATASVRYGREVAFLGVDTSDTSTSDARSFLAAHHVSYPSYRSTISALASIAGLVGLPTTIYIDRAGRVTCVRPGQYYAQGALDGDVEDCALRGGAS